MRYCVRAFEDKAVSHEAVRDIIDYARFAASSKNMQPWQVIAVTGDRLAALSVELQDALFQGAESQSSRVDTSKAPAKYWQRARECGFSLFKHKGIGRDDKEKRMQHNAENFRFFGAPVELFFLLHQDMPQRQLIDMGIFLERVMARAQHNGLASCPQASVAEYHQILKRHIPIEEGMEVIFGLALGYEDRSASVNEFRTDKLAVDDILTWID